MDEVGVTLAAGADDVRSTDDVRSSCGEAAALAICMMSKSLAVNGGVL